jgi:hypothetical protein
MAYCWKTEFYVYEGDEAVGWYDTYSGAAAQCSDPNVTRIEEVRHYQDDHEIVWER